MHENVYLNGEIVPASTAAVSVWDAGFLHGASAFTTMLVRNGKVFRLARHLGRLFETVGLLNLRTDATPESIAAAVERLIEANGLLGGESVPPLPREDMLPAENAGSMAPRTSMAPRSGMAPQAGAAPVEARMRVTLTPGTVDGQGPPVTLITTEPQAAYLPQWREHGIGVVVTAFKQVGGDPTFGYKTGCYLPRILARREAAAKGMQEALWFTTDNRLAEACFRNVFLVLDGKVLTPPRDTPVLPGVVRDAVLELCRELAIPADADTPLTIHELLAAQEVFLTGSGMGVCPVVRVERHAVGAEKPGEVTRKIMAAYQRLLERECP